MANQLATVKNVVVLMLENRSFDNAMGFFYTDQGNKSPNGDAYDGLTGNETNPSKMDGSNPVKVQRETNDTTVPTPDPHEEFQFITRQLSTVAGKQNQGFVIDYATVSGADGSKIMHCYDPSVLPCMKFIADNYAVCDSWFCSVPSQTWPNRGFAHTGWSNGHINNAPNNPLQWNVTTIFNEMASTQKASWFIYYDDFFVSLTRLQLPQLWPLGFSKHFKPFKEFLKDANSGNLSNYSFLEPNYFDNPLTGEKSNDHHPPHDVAAADTFIGQVYNAVVTSPQWKANQVLLIITHDEHGGCFDHVPPPSNATPPQPGTGDGGFDFKRLGVRVPFLLVSPYVPKGSVFRAPAGKMFDHTSILATLERRFGLPAMKDREKSAPDLGDVLSLSQPRIDSAPFVFPPAATTFHAIAPHAVSIKPLNDLQKSIVEAMHQATEHPPAKLQAIAAGAPAAPPLPPPQSVQTVEDAFDYIRKGKKALNF